MNLGLNLRSVRESKESDSAKTKNRRKLGENLKEWERLEELLGGIRRIEKKEMKIKNGERIQRRKSNFNSLISG